MLFGSYSEPNMTLIRLTVQLSDSVSPHVRLRLNRATCGLAAVQCGHSEFGINFQTLKSRLVAGFSGTGLVYFW